MENYKIHTVYWKAGGINIQVLEIPAVDIDDKLVGLSYRKGLVSKNMYDDFLIFSCLVNAAQVVQTLIMRDDIFEDNLFSMRKDLVRIIMDVNPLLRPENILINHNNVAKLKGEDPQGRPLMSNPAWSSRRAADPYVTGLIIPSINHIPFVRGAGFVGPGDQSEVADIKPRDQKTTYWKRMSTYLVINVFSKDDMALLVGGREYKNKVAYMSYLITRCVVDFEKVGSMCDQSRLTSRVPEATIVEEIYECILKINPFLKYEDIDFEALKEELENLPTMDNEYPGFTRPIDPITFRNMMGPHYMRRGRTREDQKKSRNTFDKVDKKSLLVLGDKIKERIIGQYEAIDIIVDAIQRAGAGLRKEDQPIGGFIFTGTTGIGKTETAKVLAEALTGEKNGLVTIDCSEYSQDHEYAKLIGCHVPGSQVLMADNSLKNIEDIKIGEEVITHKSRVQPVEHTHKYKYKGTIIELLSANTNIPIRVTPNHEIYAIKSKRCNLPNRKHVVCKPTCSVKCCTYKFFSEYAPEWVRADKIKEGDIVFYPRYHNNNDVIDKIDLWNYCKNLPRFKCNDEFVWAFEDNKVPRYIPINEDFMRLAGYYVSEGGNDGLDKTINFTFSNKESEKVISVVSSFRKVFGLTPKMRIQNRLKTSSYRVFFSSRSVNLLMSSLFGKNVYVKKIPDWFKDLSDDLIKVFLESAILGDGSLSVPRRVQYDTVSKNLYSGIQLLLRRLGYTTYTRREEPKNKKRTTRYRILMGGKQIDRFNKEFSGLDVKQCDVRYQYQRKTYVNDDYICNQIRSVKNFIYDGFVYDISVKEDVSYVVEIITHNSPPGYVGYDDGGVLTNAIRKDPFRIVLFDEFEKASTKLHELLLQILDEGRLTDGKGKKISFKDTIIILTSNLGVHEVDKARKGFGFSSDPTFTEEKRKDALQQALKKTFKPEFLNRIDNIVHFRTLNKEDYLNIVDLMLLDLKDILSKKSIKLEISDGVREFIYEEGIDEQYGARPLKRTIKKLLETPIARLIISEKIKDGYEIKAKLKGKEIVFKTKMLKEESKEVIKDVEEKNVLQ